MLRAISNATSQIFPLQVSSNGRYLCCPNGAPFLIHGDAAYSLNAQLSGSALTQYLDAMRTARVSALVTSLFEHKFSNDAPKNALGVQPFSTLEDIRTVQASYFDHARTCIRAAGERGMVMFLEHAYSGFGGEDEGWWAAVNARTTGECTTFGQFIGAQLKDEPNIVWVQGGDYDPGTQTKINAIMNGILSQGPASTLTTYHAGPSSSSRGVSGLTNLSVNSVYVYDSTGAPSNSSGVPGFLHARAQSPAMPFVNFEPRYEGFASSVQWIREQVIGCILSGGCGSIPGAEKRWHFNAANGFITEANGWQNSLTEAMTLCYPHMRAVFENARRWHELVPDTGSALITSGRGTAGTDGYVTAAKTADGALAMALAHGSIGVARSQMAGTFTARWFDPTNGQYTTQSGSPFTNSGTTTMTPPATNSAGDSDFVLVLEAA